MSKFRSLKISASFSCIVSLFLSLFLSLSLISCKTSSSGSLFSKQSENIAIFQDTDTEQKWQAYKNFFHKGASWDKVINLNDKTVTIKYEIIDFDPSSDSYTIQVSSGDKSKTYLQNKESFLSDLASINNLCTKENTIIKEGSYLDYDVVEIISSVLTKEELVSILPDVEGVAKDIQSTYLNIYVLPKEAFPLKTQITINTTDKTIDFIMSINNLKL